MLRYTLRRLIQAVPVVLLVVIFSFGVLRAAPGNPALVLLGVTQATPTAIAAIDRQYGLDQPAVVQVADWIGHAVRGQLGVSLASHEPVSTLIGQCLPVTVELAVAALVLTVILGIPLGILCAVKKGSWVDSTVRIVCLIWISIPSFVFAILLVLVFGWYLSGTLPYEQWVPLTQSVGGNISHLVLPAVALALGPIGIIARLTRLSMLEVLSRDYILSARAFGIRTKSILFVDALKNAALPVLAALGTITAFLLGGTVVIETVFNLPGLGSLLTSSLTGKDFPVVSGVLLVLALIIIVVNILVDLLYGIMNPRIAARYSGAR